MAKNMTFNAAIKLRTNEFKAGVKQIQGSLKSLQRTFLSVAGALGAGLGLSQLLSNLKSTAVELSVAEATLRNVSQETITYKKGTDELSVSISNYGENLKFVKDLSEKYGQDQIALTNGFAQFHAACQGTNITLEQQKEIFDALTQAATYFHMSAPQINDMQRAIVQMASKGKVTAEELRRQLGNSLPGAFNIMAQALGLTTAQLDDMMRKGQILSSDALPKFAAVLKSITANYSLDSLQISMNKLKNAWTDLVKSSDFQTPFNKLILSAEKTLKWFQKDFWPKVLGLGLGIGTTLAAPGRRWSAAIKEEGAAMEAEYKAQEKKIKQMQRRLDKVSFLSRSEGSVAYTFDEGKYDSQKAAAIHQPGGQQQWARQARVDLATLQDYNKELAKTSNLQRKLYQAGTYKPIVSRTDAKEIETLNRQMSNLKKNNAIADMPAQINRATAATRVLAGAWGTVKSVVGAALTSMAVGAVIGGITYLISKLVEIGNKWKEVRSITQNYLNDVKKADEGAEATANTLRKYLNIVKDTHQEEQKRKVALEEINKLIGSKHTLDALDKVKDGYKGITEEVENWIKAIKLAAKIQVQAQKQAEAESQIESLRMENTRINSDIQAWQKKRDLAMSTPGGMPEATLWGTKIKMAETQRSQNVEAITQLLDVAKLADEKLEELTKDYTKVKADMNKDTSGGGGSGKPKGIEKVFEDWKEEYAKLNAQLKEGVISKKKYDEELDNLISKTWGEAAGTGQLSIKSILDKQSQGKALSEIEKWYLELSQGARNIAERFIERSLGDFLDEVESQIEQDTREHLKKITEDEKKVAEELAKIKVPAFKGPEIWDNYKQSDADIFNENAEAIEDWVEKFQDIKDAMEELRKEYGHLGIDGEKAFKELTEGMDALSNTAKTLKDKARVEEWKQDIKELQEEFGSDLYNGFKNASQGIERLYDTFKDLDERFSDAEGFEKVILAFETIFEVMETGMAIIESIKKLQETTEALTKAQDSVTMRNLEKEVGLRAANTAALTAEGTAAAAAGAQKALAAKATAAAMKGEAVAGAARSAMMLPYPANLAALAENMAALAGALAAGRGFQAFANGGFVQGGSGTDNTLIKATPGELVLNSGQQKRLWDILENGGTGGLNGGKVEFEIRGDKLVGAIQNYNNKRRG